MTEIDELQKILDQYDNEIKKQVNKYTAKVFGKFANMYKEDTYQNTVYALCRAYHIGSIQKSPQPDHYIHRTIKLSIMRYIDNIRRQPDKLINTVSFADLSENQLEDKTSIEEVDELKSSKYLKGMTDKEIEVIKKRMVDKKTIPDIQDEMNITTAQYYRLLKSAKQKILKNYHELNKSEE